MTENNSNEKIEVNETNDNQDFTQADRQASSGEVHKSQPDSENTVRRVRDLIGHDAVLIPVLAGTKKPAQEGWQKLTIEVMGDSAHLARLNRGSIGVVLGAASNDLCTIDVDDDTAIEPFLALNPLLHTTLRTRGARGAQFWIRVTDEYPKLTKIKTKSGSEWGEWRADGGQSVIHGIHPDTQQPYAVQHEAKPIELAFADIQWPADLKLPWVKDAGDLLVEEHGDAYLLTERGTLHLNEFYLACRYQQEHPTLYEPLEDEFYAYNRHNGLWEPVSEDRIRWQFGLDLKRAADETCLEQFIWRRKNALLASLATTLRGVAEKQDAFKKREPVIHLANGMLDLNGDTPKLVSFHPDFYSRNLCPIEFDPNAECPRFVNELLRSALGDDDVSLIQRWVGSVLLGVNRTQRVLILTGTPGGGKSTFIEVIEKVIGERNVAQLRTKHLNKQFELYRFLGKTLLTGKDVNGEFLSEDGAEVIKALVGNDLLDAEKKHGSEQFQLRGNFNVAITCNSRLRVKLDGDVGAWARRLMIIDYSKPKPKERITAFADKLIAEEGPGILNWMIEGAIAYLQEEEEHGDYALTEDQRERVNRLLAESDSVRQFVRHRVVPCDGSDLTVEELQNHYFEYCEDFGWRSASPSQFRQSISDLMLEIHHVGKRNDIARGIGTRRGFKNVTVFGGAN